jgi:hypothetical protein
LSGERLSSNHGAGSDGTIRFQYAKKSHSSQSTSTTHRTDHNPEIYCITRDGRLIVFKLSGSGIGVGDFAKFTRGLQVWVPLRCENCGLTQFMDMGASYLDDDDPSNERSIDSGKSRIYGGHFACPSCSSTIKIETKLEYYASAGRFSKHASDGARIILLTGVREFFKSAKTASIPGYHDSDKQGSLMHFG